MSRPERQAPGGLRRRLLLLAGLVGVGAGLAVAAYLAWKPRPPVPPEVDVTGADPEVVQAVDDARAGVLRRPRDAAAWGRLGMVLRAHDFAEPANRCFAEAERLDPRDPRWPYLRGLTLLLTEPDAGIACLERAVARCGTEPPAPRLRLAEALLTQGRPDEAEEHFRRVLDAEPDNARAHLGLARLAFGHDDLDGCLAHLRVAETSPPGKLAARELLARVYRRQGDRAALRKLGSEADRSVVPAWPDPFVAEVEGLQVGLSVRLARAHQLFQDGRGAQSVALLEEIVADRPDAEQAWLLLGRVLVRLNRLAAAERILRRSLELAPESVEGWFLLGATLHGLGRRPEAAECFRKAASLKPDYALAHFNLGLCLKEQGDVPGAIKAFRATLRAKPSHAPADRELRALLSGRQPPEPPEPRRPAAQK